MIVIHFPYELDSSYIFTDIHKIGVDWIPLKHFKAQQRFQDLNCQYCQNIEYIDNGYDELLYTFNCFLSRHNAYVKRYFNIFFEVHNPDGPAYYYYKNGKLVSKEFYIRGQRFSAKSFKYRSPDYLSMYYQKIRNTTKLAYDNLNSSKR